MLPLLRQVLHNEMDVECYVALRGGGGRSIFQKQALRNIISVHFVTYHNFCRNHHSYDSSVASQEDVRALTLFHVLRTAGTDGVWATARTRACSCVAR